MFAKPSLSLLSVLHLNVFCYEQSNREQKPPRFSSISFLQVPKSEEIGGDFLLGLMTVRQPVFSIRCDDF